MQQQLTTLKLLQKSQCVLLEFANGEEFEIPIITLRAHAPAAGEGLTEQQAEALTAALNIHRIEPVGNYAVKFHFTDGHNTSLYTWDYLYQLGQQQSEIKD
jgi:DUF971 family protein